MNLFFGKYYLHLLQRYNIPLLVSFVILSLISLLSPYFSRQFLL
nr:MAG TPA: hypothetical protein [Crassvirales sp.]